MSYFSVYKNKLKAKGGSSGNSLKESGLEFIKRNFNDDPSYREATVISKENYEENYIDIRVENTRLKEENEILRQKMDAILTFIKEHKTPEEEPKLEEF